MAACDVGGTAPAPTPSEYNIQRALNGTNTTKDDVPDTVLEVLGQGGKPLEMPIQRALEERMDADFSNVRIHTGTKAAEAADAIDAKAFTCGTDIVFNSGEYAPKSPEGQFLLAHELAHVRQQTGAAISMMPKSNADLEIDPDPQLEREADEAAAEALSGDGPVVVNRMGANVHIQRTAEKAETLQAQIDDLQEQIGQNQEGITNNQDRINEIEAGVTTGGETDEGWVNLLGKSAGKGTVGGLIGATVSAMTGNPAPAVTGFVSGAASDIGKAIYGKLFEKGNKTIADLEIPDAVKEKLVEAQVSVEEFLRNSPFGESMERAHNSEHIDDTKF
ncbi:eCIS core domain-containing protein [Natrinema salifodinae]|nr:DUF4157 domain-containing protein [Natrinema salifodinae]